jgi:hypothetical protein
MQSDNKVSSFLLLILIGLGIYLLLNRGEGFKSLTGKNFNSVYPTEPFEDVDSQAITDDESQEMIDDDQDLINENSELIDESQPIINYDNISQSVNQPFYSQEYIPSVSEQYNLTDSQEYIPSISQQYIPSDTQQYIPSDNQQYIPSDSQQYIPSASVNKAPSMQNNFEPSDESIFDNLGTTLNDAFAPPIPTGTNTDTVDFKKQNMDNYNAKDFLPNEINDEWFETDFSLAKYQLNDDKLINTERYIIGINTVGQSLKNASYDIRGTIPNPKFVISPWNNSTYEPDFNLKPLC